MVFFAEIAMIEMRILNFVIFEKFFEDEVGKFFALNILTPNLNYQYRFPAIMRVKEK
jgi:hypothetical protein